MAKISIGEVADALNKPEIYAHYTNISDKTTYKVFYPLAFGREEYMAFCEESLRWSIDNNMPDMRIAHWAGRLNGLGYFDNE